MEAFEILLGVECLWCMHHAPPGSIENLLLLLLLLFFCSVVQCIATCDSVAASLNENRLTSDTSPFSRERRGSGTPRPVLTPMCVYGLTLYLVKPPSWGKCIWWMPLPQPLCPKESVGREGRCFVYLPGPLFRERRFTGYIANP